MPDMDRDDGDLANDCVGYDGYNARVEEFRDKEYPMLNGTPLTISIPLTP